MLRPPVRVCFVCSDNICRSPTAEVVLDALARKAGLEHLVRVDSAGTGGWHAGEDMDERSRATMAGAGYEVGRHIARQFTPADFATRDLVVALDSGHRSALWLLAAGTGDADGDRAKIVLLRAFDPEVGPGEEAEVGDPYFGGRGGFTEVLAQVERSCAQLLGVLERGVAVGAVSAADLLQQADSPPR